MLRRLHCSISGRVQGVSFRFFVKQEAERLNCVGTVRNCPDDTVEVVAEGQERNIKMLVAALEKGTDYSRVERVAAKRESVEKTHFSDFKIIY